MRQILFVNSEGKIAGAENSLLLLVKCLRKDFQIAVACPTESPLAKRLAEMQIDSFDLPKPPRQVYCRLFRLIHLARVSYRVVKIAYKVKPKVIHANNFYAAAASILPVVLTRQKLLWHARDLTRFRLATRICSFFCERVIAVSDTVKNLLIKQGVRPARIDVVHNGVEIRGCNSNLRKITKITSNDSPTKFANIGQFVPWKKQSVFLKAACRLIQKGSKAEFFLIGDDVFGRDPEYKVRLTNQIRNCEISQKFTLVGWQENMREIWQKIDCLVHTADREPFGRVIIEAMIHKVPVIAASGCGPSEIIENGNTGILVDANDIEQLTEAMLKIASDRKFALRLASAGYEQVISRFSAGRAANRIQKIYVQVLAASKQHENRH